VGGERGNVWVFCWRHIHTRKKEQKHVCAQPICDGGTARVTVSINMIPKQDCTVVEKTRKTSISILFSIGNLKVQKT